MLNASVPDGWSARSPFLSLGFSRLMSHLGYRTYFAKENDKHAVVHVIGKWIFSRAFVYFENQDDDFIRNVIDEIKAPYVRIGNNLVGLDEPLTFENSEEKERFTFVIDLEDSVENIWNAFDKKARNAVRKAQKEGVKVKETKDPNEIEKYFEISKETAKRAKEKGFQFTSYPKKMFLDILKLVDNNMARVVVAEYKGEIFAGCIFLLSTDTGYYWHGCSTAERRDLQAPSLIQWYIIQTLRTDGYYFYDMGGVTPNLPETDSRYAIYKFKEQWGGELKKFYNIEIVKSKFVKTLQDKIIKKIWLRLHS